jgi:hypothetical protein
MTTGHTTRYSSRVAVTEAGAIPNQLWASPRSSSPSLSRAGRRGRHSARLGQPERAGAGDEVNQR